VEERKDVLHERVAGLDVDQATIVAGVRRMEGGTVSRQCRSFAPTPAGLLELRAWLTACRCSQVAMEASGVYWKPVWSILSDGDFVLMVANAAHIKNVPGRKTDINDAMWIADLVACGLLRARFVPAESLQERRSLMRTRKQLSGEQTRHVQRIQKTLEEANIKLSGVISDVMGVSGRRMIEAMIAGVGDPGKLAGLADRRLKASPRKLYDALHGRLTDHHRFLLRRSVPSAQQPARRARRAADRDLSHAEGRDRPPRPRRQPFRSPPSPGQGQAAGGAARQARLPGPAPTPSRGCVDLRPRVPCFLLAKRSNLGPLSARSVEIVSSRDALLAMTSSFFAARIARTGSCIECT
jgi:Transposase